MWVPTLLRTWQGFLSPPRFEMHEEVLLKGREDHIIVVLPDRLQN